MRSVLLDTGPFVALLDKSEKNHERCVAFFQAFKGTFLTTEPVLTEAVYLLGRSLTAQRACIEFVVRGGATLIPQSAQSLSRAVVWMEKYQDLPMDFADATLVSLAEEAGIGEIFTLDRRGFHTYRLRGKKAFKIWPE